MLRADLLDTRKAWIAEAKGDPQEYARRQDSDFLSDMNHEGERLDFHALRRTCGAWLAMAGAHPKVVQTVMRHGSITLTMDTHGHLFPGQEADAVHRLGELLDPPAVQLATGTDGAQRRAQEAKEGARFRRGAEMTARVPTRPGAKASGATV